MKKIILALMALFITIGISGCRTATIQNVPKQTIVQKMTQEEVGKSIVMAGNSLGWNMQKVSKGVIVATLFLRGHEAVVTIKYAADGYSISYRDSKNLKYNAENQTIHSNYNGWVHNLDRAIKNNLVVNSYH